MKMASPGIPLDLAVRSDLDSLFEEFARYSPDARLRYSIRVGSKTLYSDDTRELRVKFGRYVGALKRKRKV